MSQHSVPVPDKQRRNWKKLVLLGVAVAALLAILLWPTPPAKTPTVHAARTEVETFVPPPATVTVPATPARARAPAAPAPEPAPVIDEVRVEKPEVCSGEENLITVSAHTVNGTNEFLHYVIDGAMGSAVPVRLTLDKHGQVVGDHYVRVFGRNNREVTLPLPRYRVMNCQPVRIAVIEQRLRANTSSDFDFHADVVTLPAREGDPGGNAEPFVPRSYVWDFGDGATEKTSLPVAVHSYERRAQDTLYSYYKVSVQIYDANGAMLSARAMIPLINPAFEAFAQKGIVQLLVALEPRFPKLSADGRVVQRVRIWHTRPVNVAIESALELEYFEGGAGQRPATPVDPSVLLGTLNIPPGTQGITTTVVLDTIGNPGVFSVTYQLTGKSDDGYPALGSFSVMRPPPLPERDTSKPVTDPVLEAKILAARAMLHQNVVTDEDLFRLQREGKFASLAAATPSSPGGSPAAAAPPGMPGPAHVRTGAPVPTSATPPPTIGVARPPDGNAPRK